MYIFILTYSYFLFSSLFIFYSNLSIVWVFILEGATVMYKYPFWINKIFLILTLSGVDGLHVPLWVMRISWDSRFIKSFQNMKLIWKMQNHRDRGKLFLSNNSMFAVLLKNAFFLRVHVFSLQCDIFVISVEFTEYIANIRIQGVCMYFSRYIFTTFKTDMWTKRYFILFYFILFYKQLR